MGRSRDGFMVRWGAFARYDCLFILEGVLEPEVVKRAPSSPKQRGSLNMRINSACCPGNGQIRLDFCTFKHGFIQDQHTRKRCATSGVPDRQAGESLALLRNRGEAQELGTDLQTRALGRDLLD